MGFAANSIGFLLQAEDQLSPVLEQVESAYIRFVTSIEKLNQRAYASASAGLGALASLASQISDAASTSSYTSIPQKIMPPARRGITGQFVSPTYDIKDAVKAGMIQEFANASGGKEVRNPLSTSQTRAAGLPRFGDNVLGLMKEGEFVVDPAAVAKNPHGLASLLSNLTESFKQTGGPRSDIKANPSLLPDFEKQMAHLTTEVTKAGDAVTPFAKLITKLTEQFEKWKKGLDPASTRPSLFGGASGGGGKPPDFFKGLFDMGDAPSSGGGGKSLTAAAKPLQQSLDAWNASYKAIKFLREGVEAGLVSWKAYRAELKNSLNPAMKDLDSATKAVGYDIAKTFLPDINEARNATKNMTEESRGLGAMWERLFQKILGPVRFLALTKALETVKSGVMAVLDATHKLFTVGTHGLSNFFDQMNQVNKLMGLSRSELAKLRGSMVEEMEKTSGHTIDYTELGAAFASLRAAGIDDIKVVKELSAATAMLSVASDANVDSLAAMFKEMRDGTKLAQVDMTDLAATALKAGQATGQSIEGLTQSMTQHVRDLEPILGRFDKDTQKRMIETTVQLDAVFQARIGKEGKAFTDLITQAAKGNQAAMQSLNTLGVSSNPFELQKKLQTGDMKDTLAQISGTIKGLIASGQPDKILKIPGLENLDPAMLSKFAAGGKDLNEMLEKLQAESVKTGGGLKLIEERADDNLPIWAKFTKAVENTVSGMKIFGTKGMDIVGFFNEFKIVNVAAAAYLISSFSDIGGAALKSLWKIGAWIASMFIGGKTATKTGIAATTAGYEIAAAGTVAGESAIGFGGLAIGSGAAAGGLKAAGIAAATTKAEVGGLGGMLINLGKGLGSLVGALGKGIGVALKGALTGIANGLKAFANPYVMLGAVAFTAFLGLLGLVLWEYIVVLNQAVPLLTALSKIEVKNITGIGSALSEIGSGISSMSSKIDQDAVGGMAGAEIIINKLIDLLSNFPTLSATAISARTAVAEVSNSLSSLSSLSASFAKLDIGTTGNLGGIKQGLTYVAEITAASVPMFHSLSDLAAIIPSGGLIGLLDRIWGGGELDFKTLSKLKDTVNAIGQLTVVKVQHTMAAPILSAAELKQIVQMKIEGNVNADDSGTHERLDKLLTMMGDFLTVMTNKANGTVAVPPADMRRGGK